MIKDIHGMVLTRTVAMLVNEASMLVEEEVADAADINMAIKKRSIIRLDRWSGVSCGGIMVW